MPEKLALGLDQFAGSGSIPKLTSPKSDNTPLDMMQTIDMDSYRVEIGAAMEIALNDADAEIEPVPADVAGGRLDPEMD